MLDSSFILIVHSYYRWIVLVMMLLQAYWIISRYKQEKKFSKIDFKILFVFTTIFNIQLVIGWLLYLNSTLALSFWNDIATNVKHRQIRFFGLEHMSMMTLAIILANIQTYRSYYRINKKEVFKSLFKTYIWIYFIILSSIPWSFSPLTSRPNFR